VIVIDTNVVSEIVKLTPAPAVLHWFELQKAGSLYTTTVTLAEILFGIELLPRGRRRDTLRDAASMILEQKFAGRILPFDESSAYAFAIIASEHRKGGRTIDDLDSQIAAIALSRSAALATRNVKDFRDCGLQLINPWG